MQWPLYLFKKVDANVAVGIPNRAGILERWADKGFVGVFLHSFVLQQQIPSEEAQGLVGLADYAAVKGVFPHLPLFCG